MKPLITTLVPALPILWDVVEEHLDEADFLTTQFERALDSPSYRLDTLAKGPEARLLAHVDGLLVSGPAVIDRLLAPALREPDAPSESRATAAALALLGHGRQDIVVRALLEADPITASGITRALALGAAPQFDGWLAHALSTDREGVHGLRLLRVAAARGVALPSLLRPLQSDVREEVLAAVEAACFADPARHLPVLQHLLEHEDPDIADGTLVATLVHGSHRGFQRALARAADTQRPSALAMLLVALLGTPSQQQLLLAHLERASHRESALFALGYGGQAAVVPTLLSYLEHDDARTRKLAAEAIDTLTGLDTMDDAMVLDEPEPAPADTLPPLEDELDELVPTPADELPLPNAVAVRAWWSEQGPSLAVGRRLLLGAPWSTAGVIAALERLPLRRRHALALWLAIRSGGQVRVDTDALSPVQCAQMVVAAQADLTRAGRRYGSW